MYVFQQYYVEYYHVTSIEVKGHLDIIWGVSPAHKQWKVRFIGGPS